MLMIPTATKDVDHVQWEPVGLVSKSFVSDTKNPDPETSPSRNVRVSRPWHRQKSLAQASKATALAVPGDVVFEGFFR